MIETGTGRHDCLWKHFLDSNFFQFLRISNFYSLILFKLYWLRCDNAKVCTFMLWGSMYAGLGIAGLRF